MTQPIGWRDRAWWPVKARKAGICARTGQPFKKGETVYRLSTNGNDRSLRIKALDEARADT